MSSSLKSTTTIDAAIPNPVKTPLRGAPIGAFGRHCIDLLENPLLHFVEVTDADHRAAIQLLRQHSDKSYLFCDAISIVVMRRLGGERVAAFDDHFRQIGGFEVLG